ALALDGHGRAALSEMRHGVPVPIRQFKVDLSKAASVVVPAQVAEERPGQWSGDVEPIGFPFRFGTGRLCNLFDFDYEGRWLLKMDESGLLQGWRTDGKGKMDLLPRPMAIGKLAHGDVQTIAGVAGGFVVIGQGQGQSVAAHYDVGKRICTT